MRASDATRQRDIVMSEISSSRDVIIRTPNWSEAVRFYAAVFGFAASSCYLRDPFGIVFNVGRASEPSA